MFATGTQLVALAGALELFFAGWEMIGISSAFFIGFFHERDEPVRSSVRAFATYRLSDAGLLIATVTTFELLGSARFSALRPARPRCRRPRPRSSLCCSSLSAMGKSAQLPFSGWLPRAMEGPTPSSALFYGAVSIHAGLFLLLRVWPVLEVSPSPATVGVLVGLATALYAAAVVAVHTDAKGALAHATLAQVGLILAEICLGWTTLALTHLVCHAFLRLGQYLKAPNTIHDTHRLGHGHARPPSLLERGGRRRLPRALYAASLHRLRLDDRIDTAFAPVLALARGIDRADCWLPTRASPLDGRELVTNLARWFNPRPGKRSRSACCCWSRRVVGVAARAACLALLDRSSARVGGDALRLHRQRSPICAVAAGGARCTRSTVAARAAAPARPRWRCPPSPPMRRRDRPAPGADGRRLRAVVRWRLRCGLE